MVFGYVEKRKTGSYDFKTYEEVPLVL